MIEQTIKTIAAGMAAEGFQVDEAVPFGGGGYKIHIEKDDVGTDIIALPARIKQPAESK